MSIKDLKTTYTLTAADYKKQAEKSKAPLHAEVAMVHPSNGSVVKVRDNGMVDIFVAGDNGIRIDPKSKTISFMANKLREQGGDKQSWLDNYLAKVKKDWSIETAGNINLTAKGSTNLTATGAVNITSSKALTVKATGAMSLESKAPVSIKADSTLSLESTSQISIKAVGTLSLESTSQIRLKAPDLDIQVGG